MMFSMGAKKLLLLSSLMVWQGVNAKLEGNPEGLPAARQVSQDERSLGGLGVCEGDCDSDADCPSGTYCFFRQPNQSCPGCSGCSSDSSLSDYCVPESSSSGEGDTNIYVCFSAIAQVQVQGKGAVPMADLQIGDKVLTGTNKFQPVYAFGHYLPKLEAEFLRITTEHNTRTPLEITQEHLIFVKGREHPIPAGSVKVGDELVMADAGNGGRVLKIARVQREGLYAPLTEDGSVVVDGVVASSYISLQKDAVEMVKFNGFPVALSQQDFVHLALAPFRLLCKGVSSQFCNLSNEEGVPQYIAGGIKVVKWAHRQNVVVEILYFTVALMFFWTCRVIEIIIWGGLLPRVLTAGVVSFVVYKGRGMGMTKKTKTV